MDRLAAQAREELEAVHRSYRKELVPLSQPRADHRVTTSVAATVSDRPSGGRGRVEAAGATLARRHGAAVRQPSRIGLTMVTCSDCGKPLCPDCMVFSAVGIKCKECARHAALGPGDAQDRASSLLAVAAGLATAIALGFAYYYILGSIRFFFLFIFVSAGIGYLVGEVVSRVSGRFHGLQTAVAAAAATLWAFLLPPVTAAFISYGVNWKTVVFALRRAGHHQLGRDAFRRVPRLEPQPLTRRRSQVARPLAAGRAWLALSPGECQNS